MSLQLFLILAFALLWLSSIFWEDETGATGEEHFDRYLIWLFQKLFVLPVQIGWKYTKLIWQRSVLRIRPKALVKLASQLGLSVQRFRFSSVELAGIRGSLAAELCCWIGRSVTARIANRGIPTSLRMAHRTPLRSSGVPTGDEVFDSEIAVGGDDATALALLDQHTRSQMRQLIALGGEVGDSAVKISTSGLGQGALELVQEGSKALDLAVEFSRLLTIEGPEVPGRLARNAENDPMPNVRRQNLLALGHTFPLHPESLRQHRASLNDEAANNRFVAAEFLITLPGVEPEAVREVAQVLVCLARNPELSEELRARSIRCFTHPTGDAGSLRAIAEPLIEEVLTERQGTLLVAAAIASLAALGLRQLISRLEELAPTAEYPVAIAIAKALGVLGGPQAQAILLQLLERSEPERSAPEILQEAAKALGEVGDASAVEPLLKLSRYGGKEPVGLAALEAARRIQGRLIGAEAGQLSLAAPAELEGALSAWDLHAGPGDLSLAEAPSAAPPTPAAPRRVAEGS